MSKPNPHEVKIKACDGALCDSEYQDEKYGGRRLHNPMPHADGSVTYRCTVCGQAPGAKGGPASLRRRAQIHALQVGHKILMARIKNMDRRIYSSVRRGYK